MENFRWLEGEERVSSWIKDTGFRSDFCSNCGSPVPNPLRGLPYQWIPAGLLEDGDLKIGVHVFTSSRTSWVVDAPLASAYETCPELLEFVRLLMGQEQEG
jgi:hypothetical protein